MAGTGTHRPPSSTATTSQNSAAAQSLSPAPHTNRFQEVVWGERKREHTRSRKGEEGEAKSPGSPESNNSSSIPASAFQPSRTRCPLLHPKRAFSTLPWGEGRQLGGERKEGRCKDEGHRLRFFCLSLQDATLRFSWARSAEVWHQKFITQRRRQVSLT